VRVQYEKDRLVKELRDMTHERDTVKSDFEGLQFKHNQLIT
jgi:hypothetical protein